MSNGKLGKVLLGVTGLIIAGYLVFVVTGSDSTETETVADTKTTNAQQESISLAEVATHNTESDCWSVINDKVYDITDYVPRHPGGDEILLACGTNGTSLFSQRTTTEGEEIGSGTSHSSSASSQLNGFLIGNLAN